MRGTVAPTLDADASRDLGPDASREEVAHALRSLADLIEKWLPRRADARDVFLPWETTAATLLGRIGGQGRTIALLVEGRHELDAEMVMRSLLEHTTLFAWLAITPEDESRDWKARDPDYNTLWWMVDQYKHEKWVTERQEQWLGNVIDDQMAAAIRTMEARVNALPPMDDFPKVRARAIEVDAHWAHRVDGWYIAGPGEPGFALTMHGQYWTLYTRGSASVHPDWGATRRFLKPPSQSGYQRHYVQAEEAPTEQVGIFVSIAAYLMADAIAVADEMLGWRAYGSALRILGRWDEVRAPKLLADGIYIELGGSDGRRYGRAGERLVSIEIIEGEVAVVVVEDESSWTRLSHRFGTRRWTLRNEDGDESHPGSVGEKLALGPEVMERVELLADISWEEGPDPPDDWPTSAP